MLPKTINFSRRKLYEYKMISHCSKDYSHMVFSFNGKYQEINMSTSEQCISCLTIYYNFFTRLMTDCDTKNQLLEERYILQMNLERLLPFYHDRI